MVPTYRVSHLAAYARWRAEEGDDIGWLMGSIFGEQKTEAMDRGTAFHLALEQIGTGNYSTASANGYTFAFNCDAEVVLPKTREIRLSKDYGGIIVTGKCDAIAGRQIDDHKTTSQFSAEDHLEGWQHKFYLDIFDADVFRWHCWVMKLMKEDPNEGIDDGLYHGPSHATIPYNVYEYHLLTQYRYPELEADCANLAHEFRDFAASRGWSGARAA